jgi:hypothetical protein
MKQKADSLAANLISVILCLRCELEWTLVSTYQIDGERYRPVQYFIKPRHTMLNSEISSNDLKL